MAWEHREKFKILYECQCITNKKEHHHFDYTKPCEVILLCRACHAAEHVRLRAFTSGVSQ